MKPPYRVPTMAEINELPDSGLRVVSTFAGAGGSSTGYRMAGAKVLWASEFIAAAADTYAANKARHTVLDRRDIREVTGTQILEAVGLGVGELDVLDGSPPCASFSSAGTRQAGWGLVRKYSDGAQRTDDLFGEFARILTELQPKVFVAENVTGLVRGAAKGYFKAIYRSLIDAGYRVQARRLDASWLGVPQARQRIIFMGVRNDLDRDPVYPSPLPYRYTVRDVLPAIAYQGHADGYGPDSARYSPSDRPSGTLGTSPSFGNGRSPSGQVIARRLVHDTSGEFGKGDVTDQPVNTITVGEHATNSRHWKLQEPTPSRLLHDTSGKEGTGFAKVADLTDRPACAIMVASTQHKLDSPAGSPGPAWDGERPLCPETGKALTVSSKAGRITVPPGHVLRRLTIPELRILCGFPPDFVLTGTYEQRWERLGRAVPPVMMAAIAAAITDAELCAD